MADRRGVLATLTAAALALAVPLRPGTAILPPAGTRERPRSDGGGSDARDRAIAAEELAELNRQFARLRGRAAQAQSLGAPGGDVR